MTQESINDLVRDAANKIRSVFGDIVKAHAFPSAIRINIETGEISVLPPKKDKYKTPYESFLYLYSGVLYQQYLFDIEARINAGHNKDLVLIDIKNKWIEHQRNADNLLTEQEELRYIIEYNPDNLITIEHYEKELMSCEFDQIREQLYADYYKLAINSLTTKETQKHPQLQTCAAFFLAIFVLGRLGKVKEFPFNGTSTNEAKDSVTMAAQWAMDRFGGKHNIETLHSYLKTTNVKFAKHIDIAEVFLLHHYPNEELKIKSEFTKLRLQYRE
ncbi:hypothetical protein [Runella zeae]|uniref:hypothetical protein n=1 Tax=Runella zeae TaxID=94255 RepID=UPI0004083007|nr:hypothetical protein [Runella zeae]